MSVLIPAHNIIDAWLAAMEHLRVSHHHEDFNVILEIAAPMDVDDGDKAVATHVDRFLKAHGVQALHTVANTIFPQDLYLRMGTDGVYRHYPENVYPRLRKCPKNSWGTYAHRMVRRTSASGAVVNPLATVVTRLRTEIAGGGNPKRARYELNMVDPFTDLSTSDPTLPGDGRAMGGPCLSHLSFKIREGAIALSAFYRSHYYIERALGNLLGLANLLHFVAMESGLQVGALTCISSMAKIDSGNWNLSEVERLLSECKNLLAVPNGGTTVAAVETVNAP